MIKALSLVSATLLLGLTGCTVHQSIGDSFGSYVSEPDGQAFKPVGYRWDYEHTALVYVYRPATQWSMDELESPSFNIDDKRLFNIKGGGYSWFEMEPGAYDMVMRRGLLGLEGIDNLVLRTVAKLRFEATAGSVYYLRYSEIDPPAMDSSGAFTPVGDGPLQLVPPALALSELPVTHMLDRGRFRVKPKGEEVAEEAVAGAAEAPAANGLPQQAPAAGEAGELKARPRTKAEDWWPF